MNKTRMPTFTTLFFFKHSNSSSSHRNRTKRNKTHPNWKEVKMALFVDDMIVYRENLKESTNRLLNLIEINSLKQQDTK